MRKKHLQYLCCPECCSELKLIDEDQDQDRIKSGTLQCNHCHVEYPILNYIPRFCASANYTDDFGFQWNKHSRTQYDSESGIQVSEERFFNETGWPRKMDGQIIMEAGSGAGRFTEQAASTGAMVVTFDLSNAVEANYKSNGNKENVLIVQADIFKLPFPRRLFNKVVCIGVLQHTPSPEEAFLSLPAMLKSGGHLVVDVYEREPGWKHFIRTKYWVRPFTRRCSHIKLYKFCEFWVNLLWPILKLSYQVTGRRTLSWFMLVADYRGVYQLSEDKLKQLSILDTFDSLAPEYEFPQTIESVTGWFKRAGLTRIEVKRGYNGIQGSGYKPFSRKAAKADV